MTKIRIRKAGQWEVVTEDLPDFRGSAQQIAIKLRKMGYNATKENKDVVVHVPEE